MELNRHGQDGIRRNIYFCNQNEPLKKDVVLIKLRVKMKFRVLKGEEKPD